MPQVVCLVDGATIVKPGEKQGPSSIGILIYKDGKLIGQFSRRIQNCSSSDSEWEAFIQALTICWSSQLSSPTICTDLSSIVQAMNDEESEPINWRHEIARKISRDYNYKVIKVPRAKLSEAHFLAEQELIHMRNNNV